MITFEPGILQAGALKGLMSLLFLLFLLLLVVVVVVEAVVVVVTVFSSSWITSLSSSFSLSL